MSYQKAMKHHRNIRKYKKQSNMYMGFSVLGKDERRKYPWLGSSWFENGMEEQRKQFIENWEEETKRLLKENPNLKIV